MNAIDNLTVTEAEIRNILDNRIAAIHDKNLQMVLDKYAPDVISYDLKNPLQNNGIGKIKDRLQEWFASYKGPINQEMDKLFVNACEDLAISHCLMRTYGQSTKGEKFDMWYRMTTGYKKINSQWLIIHEHVSEPIDMKTGKAIFDLKP